MRNFLKDFCYFSRGERRGVWLLCALILLGMCAGPVYRHLHDQATSPSTPDEEQQAACQQAYEDFRASLQADTSSPAYPPTYPRRYRPTPRELQPFPFDPNRTDSATFYRMGLPGWMARNIVRYREAGGWFRRPEDFRKIYGLTDEQFATLKPYIRIAPEDTARTTARQPLLRPDTLRSRRTDKYPAGTVIELNRADTAQLKRIPGIGSALAARIVRYRRQLGGYHHLEQLQEIGLNSELLRPWFQVDTTAIRRLNLNTAGIKQLNRHPYLDFYQAKAIVEWREKHGPLRSLKSLRLLEEFQSYDFRRLEPYVCFE